jgi:hypothetical protein
MKKKVNRCVLPTYEEGKHFPYSINCNCKPIVVEYSESVLYVHRELENKPEEEQTFYRRYYLRKL